ncbi:general secretion pathway protein GspB [Pseudoalteromonas sp. MMG005]|uniref:general secretion pathway protein GspB n=1 Tax=Pseudoalteromonas sp. MMG005 TaxID=2822682 RepID=UPI001B39E996|nr:general secretion pathway protein GspB [Pseudoalteromonas sp. MMG005]MBQ4847397.1 general secretion pathway protein GspB [Pseudoalteromonas sp. MMG005]
MSYLFNALKQSEHTATSEQVHLSYQHEKQLKFYRRLSLGLGGVLVFGGALVAGYAAGKFMQSPAQVELISNAVVTQKSNQQVQQPVVEGVAKSDSQLNSTSVEQSIVSRAANQNQKTQPQMAANTVVNPIQPSVQYQWASVQIGVDVSGQAVYEQRLVPVANQQAMVNQANIVQPQFVQRNTGLQSLTQPNILAQQNTRQPVIAAQTPNTHDASSIDMSQYRVLGKPLNEQASYHDPELDKVSDELKDAFAQAVADTEGSQESEVIATSKDSARATPIELLPIELQNSIPRLRYQAHIYATEADKRWIKLNNRDLYEGDSIGVLQLLEITPEQALFDFDGYEFTLKAMQDWPL